MDDASLSPWPRAFILAILSILAWNLQVCIHKIKLAFQGILYLVFCNDKKWKKPEDPGKIFESELAGGDSMNKVERKTIIFVRHGESTWNDTFNKGERSVVIFVLGWLPNLVKAVLYELYLLLTGQVDSWFYDAPLSHYGLDQVRELQFFLSEEPSKKGGLSDPELKLLKTMRGDKDAPSSILVASNLRRAISTIAAGFSERLKRRPFDKITIVPALQEISRNPDTLSVTPAQTNVTASWIEKDAKEICDFQAIFDNRFEMHLHKGNKPLNTNGLNRMTEFCNYAFTVNEDTVIVGGHSIWFRSFFKTFLPYSVDHQSKTRKIVNCGAVGFTLFKKTNGSNTPVFVIDPSSVTVVYGGFS